MRKVKEYRGMVIAKGKSSGRYYIINGYDWRSGNKHLSITDKATIKECEKAIDFHIAVTT